MSIRADPIFQFMINKIETLPRSYPKTIKALEPIICPLLRFSQNHPDVWVCSVISAIFITTLAQMTLIMGLVVNAAPLIEVTGTILCLAYGGAYMFCMLGLCDGPSELAERQLNQAVKITKMTAAYFGLDPDFVSKLNAWTNAEGRELNPRWITVREKIIDFYRGKRFGWSRLNLSNEHLRSLPDIFDLPIFRNRLKKLHLNNNQLITLPTSIGHLQSLKDLHLYGNTTLTGLTERILQLPPTCTVDISNCSFSQTVLRRLADIVNAPDYGGPHISYSMRRSTGTNRFTRTSSIEQLLRNVYNISHMAYRELSNLMEIPNLSQWLYKLSETADFRGSSQRTFIRNIIGYLERANEDTKFRDIFSATILDGVDTCGDRVALSVLKLGITFKLSTTEPRDLQRLNYLLTRGVWALELLHEIARQKIPTLRLFDEIEVYLGYPIKLREALNLPIDTKDMLYFSHSALTPEDLEIAKTSLLNTINNEKEHVNFLIDQPQWVEALKINYQEQFTDIEAKKEHALNLDDPDYVGIDNVYKQDIKNLTRRTLQSLSLSNS